MRMTRLGYAVAAVMISLATTAAHAQHVPIVNAGFESVSRQLALGEQTNGIGGDDILVGTRTPFPFGGGPVRWADPVTVPGWRSRTVPFGSPDEILAGVLRPTEIDGDPFITGIEGDNVLAIQAAVVGQKTSAVLQPNTQYTLGFVAGMSQFDFQYFAAVTLTAIDDSAVLPLEGQDGVTRLEIGRFFPPGAEPDGIMRRFEFSYTTPATLPPDLVGTHVGINVYGSDGIPRVIYDDFTLSAVTVPAPGTAACVLMALMLPGRRRRPGETWGSFQR